LVASALDATAHAAVPANVWSSKHVHTALRVISLLIAGMILGALLVLVWFVARGKNQRSAADMKVSAALIAGESQRNSR